METVRGQEAADGSVTYDNSAASRFYFWTVAVRMANDKPFGTGPGAFPQSYDEYDTTDGAYGRSRAVHSQWFGVIGEMGYVGFVFYFANLMGAWFTTIRAQWLAKRGRIPAELGLYAAGLESSLIACFVAGSFLNFQYVELVWHGVGLTIALHWMMEGILRRESAIPMTEGLLGRQPLGQGLVAARRMS